MIVRESKKNMERQDDKMYNRESETKRDDLYRHTPPDQLNRQRRFTNVDYAKKNIISRTTVGLNHTKYIKPSKLKTVKSHTNVRNSNGGINWINKIGHNS